jgi:hypothetical protein
MNTRNPSLISETDPGEGSSSCGGGGGGSPELREENARLQREITELKCLLGPEALALSAELESTRDALACEYTIKINSISHCQTQLNLLACDV